MPPSIPYAKPYLTIENQVSLLMSRGMIITDPVTAASCLQRIGYYRLSAYWYPFRKSHVAMNPITGAFLRDPRTKKAQIVVEDGFRPQTSFQTVMDLYVFDKRLRLLFLDAIERVEIALRVDIALLLGARDPWAHRDPAQLHGKFSSRSGPHAKWLDRLDKSFARSNDEFAKHFKFKYFGQHPPIWIAVELWDFGMLSILLAGMKHSDRQILAEKYGVPRAELFVSWIRNINNVRNMCAHHSRVWNRSPADQAAPARGNEILALKHISGDIQAQSRIYHTAAILQVLLKTINPTSSWYLRLKSHAATFNPTDVTAIANGGFPAGWEDLPLWQ